MVKKYADLSHDLNSKQLRGAPMGGQLEDHGPAYGLVEVCGILTRSKLSSKWGPPSGAKKSQLHEEHTNKPMKKNDRSETSQKELGGQLEDYGPACGLGRFESAVAAVGSISAKLIVLWLQREAFLLS